jgi:hypothetical protein
MLLIRKNTNSNIVLTLEENRTLTNPYYLFEFKNEMSLQNVYFIAPDITIAVERYNEFIITETSGTPDYTSGTVELSPEGMWTYRVFEQLSSTNLNPSLADNTTPLEVGIVRVIGTEGTVIRNNNNDIDFIVHEPSV